MPVLCITLYSEVRPKTTNHHSHNCNYCINTKQHTGDAQKRVWPEWNAKEVTVRNGKEKQNANIHSKKKVTTYVFVLFFPCFFLSALVLYVAVSHNDLNQKLKRCFHRMTNRRHRGGEQICTMRVTFDNKCSGKKGTKRT